MQYKVLIFFKNLMFRPISIIFVSGRGGLLRFPVRSGGRVRTQNRREREGGYSPLLFVA